MNMSNTAPLAGDLFKELRFAEQIILTMLKHMTTAQRLAAQVELDEAGISGDGMTRFHERRAVLHRAITAITPQPQTSGQSNGRVSS
jgi:hypothetical protein